MTRNEIKSRAEKRYPAFLSAWLRGEPFEPFFWHIPPPNGDYSQLRQHQTQWLEPIKYTRTQRETRQTRAHQTQTIAKKLWIDTAQDYLALIGKSVEFSNAEADLALVRVELPIILTLLVKKPMLLPEYHGVWLELLRVCQYFLEHPRPNLYARELPISVHTKFIEQYQAVLRHLLETVLPSEVIDWNTTDFEPRFGLRSEEPLIRVRFLDADLQSQLGFRVSDVSVPLSEFFGLDWHKLSCLMVENKKTFLTLPNLKNTIAIWGRGGAVGSLGAVTWLNNCQLWYWGDMDVHGFQILSNLRRHFPKTQSILMDQATFEKFYHFIVDSQPLAQAELGYLTPPEQQFFLELQKHNWRLEQERLDHSYVLQALMQFIC